MSLPCEEHEGRVLPRALVERRKRGERSDCEQRWLAQLATQVRTKDLRPPSFPSRSLAKPSATTLEPPHSTPSSCIIEMISCASDSNALRIAACVCTRRVSLSPARQSKSEREGGRESERRTLPLRNAPVAPLKLAVLAERVDLVQRELERVQVARREGPALLGHLDQTSLDRVELLHEGSTGGWMRRRGER